MKKSEIFLVAALILVLITPSFFIKAEVDQGIIAYLTAASQDEWITQGLKAAGQSNLNLDYLNNFDGSAATDFALAILAITAGGQNPAAFNGNDFVADLTALAADNQLGDVSLLNDDIWGITALKAAGLSQDNAVIQNSKNYLLTHQLENGGWSFSINGEADTNDTAAAVWALIEAGESSSSTAIARALAYLQSTQNVDGGLPYVLGGGSDSASTSWIISALNKLNINSAVWAQGENTPISYLNSLRQENGSFKWRAQDEQGNSLMTAYAAIALAGTSYPVARYVASGNNPNPENPGNGGGTIGNGLHRLRIEGSAQTICEAEVAGTTALAVLENGATVCGYTYHIQQTGFGPYVDVIGGEQAAGENGWNYRVNWLSPDVGANDYQLAENDFVLWYFSNWSASPLKITLDHGNIATAGSVVARVEYLSGNEWLRVNQATIKVDNNFYTTNEEGDAVIQFNQAGNYLLYAEKTNFVRSQREALMVGNSPQNNATASLRVLIESDNNGGGGGVAPNGIVALAIENSSLDFGSLSAGEHAERVVRISNRGNVAAYVESVVSGDSLFSSNLYLDNGLWENYQTNLTIQGLREVNVSLRVPNNYTGAGVKEGSLVFWASGASNN